MVVSVLTEDRVLSKEPQSLKVMLYLMKPMGSSYKTAANVYL